MTPEKRDQRARQIENAAYEILEKKGFSGLSMQAVARAAKASNETLYRWYGDKVGLFEALIRGNAELVVAELDALRGKTPIETLGQIGPRILTMLLGPRAIALNRAAAADPGGTLGAALAREGRMVVGPRIAAVIQGAIASGQLSGDTPERMTEVYFGLLIGDQQIRRVTGASPMPDQDEINTRAESALALLRRIFPPELDAQHQKTYVFAEQDKS